MSTMVSENATAATTTVQDAAAWVTELKREVLNRRRSAGSRRNINLTLREAYVIGTHTVPRRTEMCIYPAPASSKATVAALFLDDCVLVIKKNGKVCKLGDPQRGVASDKPGRPKSIRGRRV